MGQTKAELKAQEKQEAIDRLRDLLPKNGRIYVNITHVSRTNESWSCTVSVVKNGSLLRVTREVAKAIEWDIRKDELKGGGTVDAASTIAYSLGSVLYGEPYSIKPDYV